METQTLTFWNALVGASSEQSQHYQLEDVYQQAKVLSLADKVKLVEKLLQTPGLFVVFGNQQLTKDVIEQIDTMDSHTIAGVLDVLANQVKQSG